MHVGQAFGAVISSQHEWHTRRLILWCHASATSHREQRTVCLQPEHHKTGANPRRFWNRIACSRRASVSCRSTSSLRENSLCPVGPVGSLRRSTTSIGGKSWPLMRSGIEIKVAAPLRAACHDSRDGVADPSTHKPPAARARSTATSRA